MKKIIYISIILLAIVAVLAWQTNVFATDSGALSPGTMADDATVGTVAWNTPDAAKTEGTSYTYAIILLGTYSHYLKATNFGFSIPTGATINGIIAEAKTGRTNGIGITKDYAARIVKADGTIGTTDKSNATQWTGSWNGGNMVYLSHGASNDLWGESWTAENINDVDFGFALSAQNNDSEDGDTAQVDHIRITVYYTETVGSVSIPKVAVSSPTFINAPIFIN